jgi:hypothetical protein
MANVIEVLLRGTDDTASLRRGITSLRTAFAALGAGALLTNLIANISEAESSTAQLDVAFKNTGATLGKSRQSLDDLAKSMQKTTTFSDDLVKQGEAILLTFDKVRGEAFERTARVAADLAERTGGDLVSSMQQLGRALNDPLQGLTLLRRSGIQFSESQQDLIKDFIKTGEAAKAQEVILTELERRYKGSAEAARNTLGGSLKGLKNAFGDLFEGTTQGTSGATDAINSLAASLANPDIKAGIDITVTGLAKMAELVAKLVGLIGSLGSKAAEVIGGDGVLGKAVRGVGSFLNPASSVFSLGMTALKPEKEKFQYQYDASSRFPWETPGGMVKQKPELEEINVTLQQIRDGYVGVLQEMEEATRSSTEKQAAEFIKFKTTLEFLRDEGLISPEKYSSRLGSELDELLPEININEIKSMYMSVKQESTELSEFVKGVWQGAGNSIRQTLSDAAYEGKLSLRSLVDIGRRVVADLIAAFTTSQFKEIFKSLASSSKAGGGGFWSMLGGLFGFAAGGGDISRPTWVGEEGRELVVPKAGGARVYNQRQLAGMGSNMSYAPTTNIQVIEREDQAKTTEAILNAIAMQRSEDMEELMRMLAKSGVEVRS